MTTSKAKLKTTATQTTLTVDARTFNVVAQLAHFAGGLAIVFGAYSLWGMHAALIATGILAVVAAVKEFWYDYRYETPAERGSSALDFAIYLVGAGIALALLYSKLTLVGAAHFLTH